jgi:hypothetical protein
MTITFPQKVTLTVPDPYSIKAGSAFTISTQVTPQVSYTLTHAPKAGVQASMQTFGPTVQAMATMNVDAHLFGGAEACFGFCVGPNLSVGLPAQSQELLALNYNNDGKVRVLGSDVRQAGGSIDNKGVVSLNVQPPKLNSDSLTSGGLVGNMLQSGERSNVFALGVSFDRVVSDLLGLPPLHGSSNGFGYNLLTAGGDLNVDVKQSFSFDPNLQTKLHFSNAVQLASGGGMISDLSIPLGSSVDLKAPGALSLGILPTFSLANTAHNQTSLVAAGHVAVSAGGLDIFGETLGPIVNESTSGDIADVSLVDNSFHVNMADVVAKPFNLLFDLTGGILNATETQGGFVMGGSHTNCVANCAGEASWQDILSVSNLYSYFASPDPFGPKSGCATAFCTPDRVDPAIFDVTGISQTSQSLLDELTGDPVFINDYATYASLADTFPLAVASDNNAGAQQRLAALGFTGSASTFDIPQGDPFPDSVPEPSTLALVGIAGFGLLFRRRARA